MVAQLNAAFAEGRLDVAELDERVAAAYAAKTLGELVPLTADLPVGQQQGRSAAPARREDHAPVPADAPSPAVRWAPVTGALGLFLVNVVIWGAISLGTGEPDLLLADLDGDPARARADRDDRRGRRRARPPQPHRDR